ncbi:multinuclear nonheme iron-dependent oxidase [Streptosporangium sp. OZ121]|uniref:multinuclear nonheme iron-dependent oxidase n=1 Tax=Streptosporangium sp. OZ121 TaxID=3444183 RepID=UPI003F79CA39
MTPSRTSCRRMRRTARPPSPPARDSRSAPVPGQVWQLLDHLLTRVTPRGSLLERSRDFPDDFSEIFADLRRARRALGAAVNG